MVHSCSPRVILGLLWMNTDILLQKLWLGTQSVSDNQPFSKGRRLAKLVGWLSLEKGWKN